MDAEFLASRSSTFAFTIHDWLFSPQMGFFPALGSYQQKFNISDILRNINGNDHCSVTYQKFILASNNPIYKIVRFPLLFFLCIAGIIIGLYGFIEFIKHYQYSRSQTRKKNKIIHESLQIPLQTLCLSFLFFSFMNVSGIVYHCLIAVRNPYRILFRIADQSCTGISGLLLGLSLNQLFYIYKRNKDLKINTSKTLQARVILVIVSFVLCAIRPILGEIIYLVGCIMPCQTVVQLFLNRNAWMPYHQQLCGSKRDLVKICFAFFGIFIFFGFCLIFVAKLCVLSNSEFNIISIFYFVSNVGYFSVLYFINEYIKQCSRVKMN